LKQGGALYRKQKRDANGKASGAFPKRIGYYEGHYEGFTILGKLNQYRGLKVLFDMKKAGPKMNPAFL